MTVDKFIVLNCCYPQDSIQKRLEPVLFEKAVMELEGKAGLEGASLIVARPGDGTIPEQFPSICAEPSALCNLLSGLPAMTSEGLLVNGIPAEVHSVLDFADSYAVLVDDELKVIEEGSTWRDLIGDRDDVRFIVAGKLSPAMVDPSEFDSPIPESLFDNPLFDGVIRMVSSSTCPVMWLKREAESSRLNSCGRCVFCRLGTKQIGLVAEAVSKAESTAEEVENIQYISSGMAAIAGCEYGRRFGDFVDRYMELFSDEFTAHVRRRKCSSLECPGYITYHVLPNLCQGCDQCRKVCTQGAIDGEEDEIHVIDKDACSKCGECLGACPNKAIVKAGLIKPRTPKQPVPVGSWTR